MEEIHAVLLYVTGCRAAAVAFFFSTHPWWWSTTSALPHYLLTTGWWWYVMPEYNYQRSVFRAALEGLSWLMAPYLDSIGHRAVLYGIFYLMEDLCLLVLWTIVVQWAWAVNLVISLALLDLAGRAAFILYSIYIKKFEIHFEYRDVT